MIIKMNPVHLADVGELAGDLENKPELKAYLKEFSKLDKKKSDALLEGLRSLNNHKIKEESMVKIIDLLPKDSESLVKIFNDVSLDEKELEAILNLVKEY